MLLFRRLTQNFPRPIRVLDLGGTQSYWESNDAVDADVFRVTLVNLPKNAESTTRENFESRLGDATDLSAIDRSEFDLVYSNSVIEHLATMENQERMAQQIQSLDLPFWIQTPNYYFPMEPHYHVLGYHWMSRERRIRMLQKKRCGMRGPVPEREGAAALVDEVRLMKCREVREIFPNASIYRERIGPFTKSIVAHQGLG